MSGQTLKSIAYTILIVWVMCVVKNWWTDGTYKIPADVTSVLAALVGAIFTAGVLEGRKK